MQSQVLVDHSSASDSIDSLMKKPMQGYHGLALAMFFIRYHWDVTLEI